MFISSRPRPVPAFAEDHRGGLVACVESSPMLRSPVPRDAARRRQQQPVVQFYNSSIRVIRVTRKIAYTPQGLTANFLPHWSESPPSLVGRSSLIGRKALPRLVGRSSLIGRKGLPRWSDGPPPLVGWFPGFRGRFPPPMVGQPAGSQGRFPPPMVGQPAGSQGRFPPPLVGQPAGFRDRVSSPDVRTEAVGPGPAPSPDGRMSGGVGQRFLAGRSGGPGGSVGGPPPPAVGRVAWERVRRRGRPGDRSYVVARTGAPAYSGVESPEPGRSWHA